MWLARALLGMAAAMAPSRHWTRFDRYVPASTSALASSLATFLIGGVLAVSGYVDFTRYQARAISDAAFSSAEVARADDSLTTFVLQGVSSLSLLAYLLTPTGLLTSYFTLSGAIRAVDCVTGDGFGDPILTGADAAVSALWRRSAGYARGAARTRREGPEIADRIYRGTQLAANAELVIVSSRRKAGWDAGTIVRSSVRFYRVVAIEERSIAGMLRTLYLLNTLHDHAAIRRMVDYEIPERYVESDPPPS